MFKIEKIRQYTRIVKALRFPRNPKNPYVIGYLSENSSLINDYQKLNIRLMDVRDLIVPLTKIPRTILSQDIRNRYKMMKIVARSSTMKIPEGRNLFLDLTVYTNKVDELYRPTNYRQRAGLLINNLIQKSFSLFPDNYTKVLMYSINVNEDIPVFHNRKVFSLLQQMKTGDLPYDYLVLAMLSESGPLFRVLVQEKEYNISRIIPILKRVKPEEIEKEKEEDVNKATDVVIKQVSKDISPSNVEKVKSAVTAYLKTDEKETAKVLDSSVSDEEKSRTAIAAVLYKTSGKSKSSQATAKSIPSKSIKTTLQVVDKNYADQLLEKQKSESSNIDPSATAYDIPEMVDNKTPEHIFQRRQIDFEKNLVNDVTNSFKVLESKEIPIKVKSVNIIDKPQKSGELEKSDLSTVHIELENKYGKFKVEIDIPKIDPGTGTFLVNGRKKCLINQLVLCPITFLKVHESKFESSYSAFHIRSKQTRSMSYLEIYIGSYTLPLLILLAYRFGFTNTLKRYGITHSIQETKSKEEFSTKLEDDKYIVFHNVDTALKIDLCKSFVKTNFPTYNIKTEFDSEKYWNNLIIKMTGRINSTFLISSVLENIVDPVAKQVLINKQLPFEIEDIIQYMASKVVIGHVEARGDLANQRIRNSEVLVHLTQKRILAAYTEYKERVLSGNEQAKFEIPSQLIMRDFNALQVVADMEYANPVEEMAVMTRVTPVGKGMGGIPDKRSVSDEARDCHPSYFGNIDPLDTAESDNIGVTQHLTVNSMITSARGLFDVKEINDNEKSGILSVSASLSPFIETTDGARVIMAVNQVRQALPLKSPEPPIIQTGYESLLPRVLSDNYIKKAPCNGKVEKITPEKIFVRCKAGDLKEIDITPKHLHSGSGKDTLSVFNPTIKEGQIIKENQLIAEGGSLKNGTISLGRNLCTAIMPYKGYNFEDGIVINERLIESEKFTSLHSIEEEIPIAPNDRLLFITELGKMTEKGEPILRKTIGDIEELIGMETDEDDSIEISQGQFIKKSPGGKIVDIQVFSNMPKNAIPKLVPLIERTNRLQKKPEKEKYTIRGKNIKGIVIKIKIEQDLNIRVGDKLCNRHGNKGIISLVEKDSYMPITEWGDKVDIIINPLGIIGRMNIGQIYELYMGLISKNIAMRITSLRDREKIGRLLQIVLSTLDTSKNNEYSSKFISNYKKLKDSDFIAMLSQIKETGFFPLIVPPFKAPSYREILQVMKTLKISSKYNLRLPEFNATTANPVPVGYMYFYKLEHIAKEKIHSRSTGPVVQKTRQPTGGKQREGGQRAGEADVYSLISYNAISVLAEMFGPLSDDLISKNEIISEIVQTGKANYRAPKISPAKELLNNYFTALMLQSA